MKLKVKLLSIDAAGKTVVVLNKEDAEVLGVKPLERVVLRKGKKKISAVVNVSTTIVRKGRIGVFEEVKELLKLKPKETIDVEPREPLISKLYIHAKRDYNRELGYNACLSIIKDVIERNLNDLEIASFLTALHIRGLTKRENLYLTKAMVKFSRHVKFKGKVCDKHSFGCAGDKTSLLVVPLIASAGLTIPKTSSRAILDPAGTADRMEVFCRVDLSIKEMKRVVEKTNACIIWGGAVELSPADDLLIQVEHPLGIDPMLIPSVLSKKKVVHAKYVIIDITLGKGGKVKTLKEAKKIASVFTWVARRLNMRLRYVISDAKYPVGYTLGPALEAKEALEAMMYPEKASDDLRKKVLEIASKMFTIANVNTNPWKLWETGALEEKFREIVKAQGGDEDITPRKIKLGKYRTTIKASVKGRITDMDTRYLVHLARLLGAPHDKGAGIYLHKKVGDEVKRHEPLLTLYAENKIKLKHALKMFKPEVIKCS